MQRNKMRFAFIAVLVVSAVPQANAEVKIDSSTKYYDVPASTSNDAVRWINSSGPLSMVEGKNARALGTTNWGIKVNYLMQPDLAGCRTKSVVTAVTLEITL